MPTHIQTDEHDTHTDKCMHISITHTHTYTHIHIHTYTITHRHRHASDPPATPRSHTHTGTAHALTRANRARAHLLQAALTPLVARNDAYTLRCLCMSPAPPPLISLPPTMSSAQWGDPVNISQHSKHWCAFLFFLRLPGSLRFDFQVLEATARRREARPRPTKRVARQERPTQTEEDPGAHCRPCRDGFPCKSRLRSG